jgi:hypothetical protein
MQRMSAGGMPAWWWAGEATSSKKKAFQLDIGAARRFRFVSVFAAPGFTSILRVCVKEPVFRNDTIHASAQVLKASLMDSLLTIIADAHVTARELFSSSITILALDSMTASRFCGSVSIPLSLVTITHPFFATSGIHS